MLKVRLVGLVFCVAILGGCASFEAPLYSPDYQIIDALKSEPLNKLSLGEFSPMDPQAAVNKISLRAAGLKAKQGTFTLYFKDALQSDLVELGIYDEASPFKISVELLENDIDISGLSKGFGVMTINLKIKQDEVVLLNKQYSTQIEFESSFAAAVAVPKAQSEYPVLVKSLLAKIYLDREFIKAVTKI
ncbi:hypothetical protein WNY58_12475 [Neptuniibacter pectenicola]|jgi:hypothetical protein|uniref:Lipoprotein n=1 Tax=Neptuniibacter pectenicola TaxID=1806669 RepID=A0ABU9TU16_9GAMM